jgi:hypothetical protein
MFNVDYLNISSALLTGFSVITVFLPVDHQSIKTLSPDVFKAHDAEFFVYLVSIRKHFILSFRLPKKYIEALLQEKSFFTLFHYSKQISPKVEMTDKGVFRQTLSI